MAVNSTTPVTNTTTTTTNKSSSAASAASLNYDSFLKLLIAQMKNQDPTSPMDATQQVSQLATFSQVEQTIQTNKNLESILQNNMMMQANSYIGKTVTSADGTVTGVIGEVKIYSDGIVGVTDQGGKILLQAGISVKDTATAAADTTTTTTDTSKTAAQEMGSDSSTSS